MLLPDISRFGRVAIAQPAGDIDLANFEALRDQLLELLKDRPDLLLVDLQHVPFIDSTGLTALVVAAQHARRSGGRFAIVGARPPLRRVLQITGLDAYLGCRPTPGRRERVPAPLAAG
jgi:anti-sigma B factor antagonist